MDREAQQDAFERSVTNREYEIGIREPTPMPPPSDGTTWAISALALVFVVGVIIGALVF